MQRQRVAKQTGIVGDAHKCSFANGEQSHDSALQQADANPNKPLTHRRQPPRCRLNLDPCQEKIGYTGIAANNGLRFMQRHN